MMILKRKDYFSIESMRGVICRFLLVLLAAAAAALLIHPSWIKYINLCHTILELACVFIALSIFISIWYTYDKGGEKNNILCFGFLIVAVYDALHAYYYLNLSLEAASYFDLATRFWILGRFTQAAAILLAVMSLKVFLPKYASFAITLAMAFGTAYFIVVNHDYLPIFLTSSGVTSVKTFMEYISIFLYLISIYFLKDKVKEEGQILYKYILISLMLSICSGLCFAYYSSIYSLAWTMGHILKIASYFYLFKGIFIRTVIFPYEELTQKHKKLEIVNEEIKQMSDTMRDLLDALPIAMQKFGSNGELRYTNKCFEELLECNREELMNLSIMDVVNKFSAASDYEAVSWDNIQHYFNSSTSKVFKTLKGKQIRLSVKAHKISNDTLYLFNETKKEQELQNLSIQTETILNSIINGVMMIDENRRVVLFNKVFEAIYEVDRNEIIGMDLDDLNEVTHAGLKELTHRVLCDNVTAEVFDVSITSFKDSKKEINLYVSPIKNVEGEVIGGIIVGTDVTEQKKEQQRMMQQEKLALLGQMGAGIVHETRNFLTTIKGRCQLIDMLAENESVKKHSAKINSDVEEVNRIISEFLFLSKPRETELAEVSIYDLFESIKGMIETSSLVKGVNLEISLCNEERYMLCDQSQLKQVILNICKNGIDAMSEVPDAKLAIETGFQEETNEVFILIKDKGKGIAKENLEKIGTPFFTTKSNGTGLGLSVCYKIIKEHGGRIDLHSQLGKGTSFKIILPCIEDEPDDYV